MLPMIEALEGRMMLAGGIGQLDPTFGDGGIVVCHRAHEIADWVEGAVMLGQGKVLGIINDEDRGYTLAESTRDGRIVQTFGQRGQVEERYEWKGYLLGWGVQPSGKIIVAFHARYPSVSGGDWLARYLPDGRPDQSFGNGGSLRFDLGNGIVVGSVSVLADGRILAGGGRRGTGTPRFVLRMYDVEGRPDESFGVAQLAMPAERGARAERDILVDSLAVDPQGRIVVIGWDENWNKERTVSTTSRCYLARFSVDGKADMEFGRSGVASSVIRADGKSGLWEERLGAGFQSNGKIVVSAGIAGRNAVLLRFNDDGTLDQDFGENGRVSLWGKHRGDEADIAIDGNDRIVVALPKLIRGHKGINDDVLVGRLLPGGKVDQTFGRNGFTQTDLGGFDTPLSVAVQNDGGILLMGTSSLVAGGYRSYVVLARYLGQASGLPPGRGATN